MNEELSTLIQVIRLYGTSLGALGRGIRLTAAGASGGLDLIKLKNMQHKIKLHFASEGKHETMKLSDLERLTGENYNILNIPTEDEDELIDFYDRLKKSKISFAELPDLMLGDGYTQIAYDPQDAARLKTVVEYYRDQRAKKSKHGRSQESSLYDIPQDMSLEDYIKTGGEEGERLLAELAVKGYQVQTAEELINTIKDRNQDKTYLPITLNRGTQLVSEKKDAYFLKVPGLKEQDGTTYAIKVPKSEAVYVEAGRSIYTHLREDQDITLYAVDDRGRLYESLTHDVKGYDVTKHFIPVSHKLVSETNKLKATDLDKLPDFTRGQGYDAPVPSHTASKIQPPSSEEQLSNVLKLEKLKGMYMDENHLILDIDMAKHLLVSGPSQHMIALPGDWNTYETYCIGINKDASVLSDDGKVLRTFVDKQADIVVHKLSGSGKDKGEFVLSGEDIAKSFDKSVREFRLRGESQMLSHTTERTMGVTENLDAKTPKPHVKLR